MFCTSHKALVRAAIKLYDADMALNKAESTDYGQVKTQRYRKLQRDYDEAARAVIDAVKKLKDL